MCVVGNTFGIAKGSTYLSVPGAISRPATTTTTTTARPPPRRRTTTKPTYFETGHIYRTSTSTQRSPTMRPTFASFPDVGGPDGGQDIYKHIEAMHEHLRYVYTVFDKIRMRLDALERTVY